MIDFQQMTMTDFVENRFHIGNRKVRLIELFAGVGSQAMALRDLGVDFEHHRVVEFDKYAIKSYNAIHGTEYPTMDIRDVHAEDLAIRDTDEFVYIVTYSFPCQDLSNAGLGKGMAKGSGTRSGLLWEVERILDECEDLPQVLLMENVPQVHGKKNMADFQKWLKFLEDKGYSNFWQDLNAKDYGVAQSRNRCFCVSILGEYTYKFPEPIPLTKTMKDYLEDEVEDFYLSREPRVYIPYAPTLRSDRLGLKVIEVTMSIQELDREIARVKAALAKTTSTHLKSDYGNICGSYIGRGRG